MKNEEINLNEKQCPSNSQKKNINKQINFDNISNVTPSKTVNVDCSQRSVSPVLNRKRKGTLNQKNENKIRDIRKCEKQDKLYSFSLFTNIDSSAQKAILGKQKSVTEIYDVQSETCSFLKVPTGVTKTDNNEINDQNISEKLKEKECFTSKENLNSPFITENSKIISDHYNCNNFSYEQNLDNNIGFKTATGKVLNIDEKSLQAAKALLEGTDWTKPAVNKKLSFSTSVEVAKIKSQPKKITENVNVGEINKCCKEERERENSISLKLHSTTKICGTKSLLESEINFNKKNDRNSSNETYCNYLKLDNENDFCSEITDSQLMQAVDIYDDFQKKEEININLNEETTINDKVSRKRKKTSPVNHSNSKLRNPLSFNISEKSLEKTFSNNNLSTHDIKRNKNMFEFQELFEDKCDYDHHSNDSSPMSFESLAEFQNNDILAESSKCTSQTNTVNDNLVTNINSKSNLESAENTTLNCSNLSKSNSKKKLGFRTAIGNIINVNSNSLQKAKFMFSDIENSSDVKSTDLNISKINVMEQPSIKSESVLLKNSDSKSGEKKESLINKNLPSSHYDSSIANIKCFQIGKGFATASGTKIKINDKAMIKANNIFCDLLEHQDQKNLVNEKVLNINKENKSSPSDCMKAGFKTALGSDIIISESLLAKSNEIFSDINKSFPENTSSIEESDKQSVSKYIQSKSTLKTKFESSVNSLKKENCFNSNISVPVLDKNLEDLYVKNSNDSNQLNTNDFFNNQDNKLNKNFQSICYETFNQNRNIFSNAKPPENCENKINICICLDQPKKGEIKNLINENQREINVLKQLINVMEIRHIYLLRQEKIQQEPTKEHLSFRPGLLLQMKTAKNVPRISLYEIKQYEQKNLIIVDLDSKEFISKLKKIDPQNAKNIVFNFPSPPNPPILTLPEGAIIVPTISNNIGLYEFEMSFITMPGVNPSQLPNGWFQNHFRLIVWKLASMDRQFSNYFCDHFLIPKNIMAQLKYRYDRDVHGNERSAIRKILEKDDNVSRRMVLCVAQIVAHTRSSFEIEVTDGWYSVFASLDKPLQKMVEKNKIIIGTKLITHGAKILNSEEACHPLSAPTEVRLALNFNSSRRARWDCKLGFQKSQGPFSISLNSIDPGGGNIGKVTVQIIRVFPVKYLEKYQSDGRWVCRCEKSEQAREVEWQTERSTYLEKIQTIALNQLENEQKVQSNNIIINNHLLKNSKLSNISCPKILSDLCASDPDYFMSVISESQQNLIHEYQSKMQTDHASQFSVRVAKLLENEKCTNRIVYPIVSALVIDKNVNDESSILSFMLDYWKPDEHVLEIFKEGSIISLSNIIPSEREPFTIQTTKHTKVSVIGKVTNSYFERHYTTIEKAISNDFFPILPYFDTVGIIVRIDTYENKRTVWLADNDKRIMQIQQYISPLYCAALNNARVAEVVCFYNLYFAENRQVQAKWCTIMTKYPTHECLMKPLIKLQSNLLFNVNKFVKECNEEIKVI